MEKIMDIFFLFEECENLKERAAQFMVLVKTKCNSVLDLLVVVMLTLHVIQNYHVCYLDRIENTGEQNLSAVQGQNHQCCCH